MTVVLRWISSARVTAALMTAGLLMAVADGDAVAAPEEQTITIASGRTGGLYHPVAGAICKLVNAQTAQHGITCTVAFGVGSVSNINELRRGEVTMAMAQSDTHRDAVDGAGPFQEDEPFADMRSLFALFVEQVTIVARQDKNISALDDLKGKRLYLPELGSGGRILLQRVMEAEGWTEADMANIVEVRDFKAPNLAQALCDNEIDAFSLTVGHPSPVIKEATVSCDALLVPVAGPGVDALLAQDALYARAVVPAGLYRGNDHDVAGLGLVATLVTTAATPPDVIYQVTKSYFASIDRLRSASPLFSSLDRQQMATAGLTAPVHDGALRYFVEAGLTD